MRRTPGSSSRMQSFLQLIDAHAHERHLDHPGRGHVGPGHVRLQGLEVLWWKRVAKINSGNSSPMSGVPVKHSEGCLVPQKTAGEICNYVLQVLNQGVTGKQHPVL